MDEAKIWHILPKSRYLIHPSLWNYRPLIEISSLPFRYLPFLLDLRKIIKEKCLNILFLPDYESLIFKMSKIHNQRQFEKYKHKIRLIMELLWVIKQWCMGIFQTGSCYLLNINGIVPMFLVRVLSIYFETYNSLQSICKK